MKHLLNQNLQPHTRLNPMATPLHRALRSVRQHCGKAAMAVAMVAVAASFPAKAQALSEASAALSLLPVASVVGTASVASAAAGALVAVPAAVLVGGAVLTVAALQASAVGTVYVLERTSDGAQCLINQQCGQPRPWGVPQGGAQHPHPPDRPRAGRAASWPA